MANQNLNLVLKNLCAANADKQGRDAVAGVLGQRMRPSLSQGRSMSPGFSAFEPTLTTDRHVHVTRRPGVKRVGRPAASLPGNPVCSRSWQVSATGVTTCSTGSYAGKPVVTGRGKFDWCQSHPKPSGHDYPSHDRRDDRSDIRTGFVLFANCGK